MLRFNFLSSVQWLCSFLFLILMWIARIICENDFPLVNISEGGRVLLSLYRTFLQYFSRGTQPQILIHSGISILIEVIFTLPHSHAIVHQFTAWLTSSQKTLIRCLTLLFSFLKDFAKKIQNFQNFSKNFFKNFFQSF